LISAGQSEFETRTSASSKGESTVKSPEQEALAVRALISQLCEHFFKKNWAPGTGGGVRQLCITRFSFVNCDCPAHDPCPALCTIGWYSRRRTKREQTLESLRGSIFRLHQLLYRDDVFELDMESNVVVAPKTPGLRQSACTRLWYVVFEERANATCVIHTHSMNSMLATLLDPTEESKTLKITHLEMIKGVGNHAYDDILEIPIVDNRPSEDMLEDQLREAIRAFPKCNAVLVRRHGLYVWGDSWEQAKTQCESFDYLFESAIKMKELGIDPGKIPKVGTFRVLEKEMSSPPNKKQKTGGNAAAGFNASQGIENAEDLQSNEVPIMPRDAKVLLLDIEGCTTSISFVHSVLFPYAREHLSSYLETNVNATQKEQYLKALSKEVSAISGGESVKQDIVALVQYLMDRDVKSATLKDLQGKIWKAGYTSGQLKAHVYDDFPLTLQWMKQNGVRTYIYSSGSIGAQKLLFGNTETAGNLLDHFAGHFDIPTAGPKKEAPSYTKIAKAIDVPIEEIVFVSDLKAELEAAASAGMKYTIQSIRPGNAPIGKKQFPTVHSLLQLCGK